MRFINLHNTLPVQTWIFTNIQFLQKLNLSGLLYIRYIFLFLSDPFLTAVWNFAGLGRVGVSEGVIATSSSQLLFRLFFQGDTSILMQANASILQVTITWGVCTCDICIDVFICSPIYATILAPPPAVYTVALRCDWPIKITQIQITNLVIFYHWLGPPVSLGLYVTLQRYLGFLYQMWLCRAQVEQYNSQPLRPYWFRIIPGVVLLVHPGPSWDILSAFITYWYSPD